MQASYYDYLQWVNNQNQQQQNQQQNGSVILAFVANRTAADLFNVHPGQRAILVDSDAPYVYVKERSANSQLLPLEVYDLVKHVEAVQEQNVNLDGYIRQEDVEREYVRKADLDAIVADQVEKKFSEAFSRPNRKKQQED